MRTVTVVDSPLGPLTLVADGAALAGLYLPGQRHRPELDLPHDDSALPVVREQLQAYFAGRLQRFDVPLALTGSPFQQAVWSALQDIPYGETRSYGKLAAELGRPGASRAVGLANGRNPVAIVVPCHRVVGATGRLTGYAGGLDRKQLLLDLEARYAA